MPEFVRRLSPEEETAIGQLLRSRTVPAGYYLRALIIHFSSQGETPAEIARAWEKKYTNVEKGTPRFNGEGPAALTGPRARGRKHKTKKSGARAGVETMLISPR